jgi:hypothetical protein
VSDDGIEHIEDPQEAEAWRLAEEFDRAAREEEGKPDPELLAALAAAASNEVLMALLSQLGELCGENDRAAADRYTEHLIALSAVLGNRASRMMRAAVGVQIADLCARTDDIAGAKLWVHRSEAYLSFLPAWLLGDFERVLACVGESEGRAADLYDHAKRARDLFAKDERWREAAGAAEAVAGTHMAMTADAMIDWRRAAELNIDAGLPDDAQACVQQAGQLLFQTMAAGGDARTMVPLCEIARELARAHHLPELAARIGLAMAAYAGDSDRPWAEVVHLHEQSKRELSELDFGAEQLTVELARVDLSLGRAALAHRLANEAECYLSAARTAFLGNGLSDELQACETMLFAVRAVKQPNAIEELVVERVSDPDLRAGLLLTDGLRLAAQGRLDEGLARVAEATKDIANGTPNKTLILDAVTTVVKRAAGDNSTTPAVLARINHHLAADGPHIPRSERAILTQIAEFLNSAPALAAEVAPIKSTHDLNLAIADFGRLRADLPNRGELAAALVEDIVRSHPGFDTEPLRELDDLVDVADAVMPQTPQWIRTRTAARIMTLTRALAIRELTDPYTATARLDELEREADADPALAPLFEAAKISVRWARVNHQGDSAAQLRLVHEMSDFLDRGARRHPGLQPLREMFSALASTVEANVRGVDVTDKIRELQLTFARLSTDDLPPEFRALKLSIPALLAAMAGDGPLPLSDEHIARLQVRAEQPHLSAADRALEHSMAAYAALRGGEERDLNRVEVAMTHLRRALELTEQGHPQRAFHLGNLALGLYRRSELTNSTADLREARTLLIEGLKVAGGPAHPQWPMLNEMLADIDRLLGDRADSHLAAVAALQGHVWQVLVQPDLESAAIAARDAAADAMSAARTCLVANDPAAAMAALDAGRGLALFAATEIHSIADRLDEAGETELAGRWRRALALGDPARLSSELRRDVLTVLTAQSSAADLLDPPDLGMIQNALTAIDADALIYLMPGAGVVPGYAIAAPVVGRPSYLALPNLTVDNEIDVERYLDTLSRRDRAISGRDLPVPRRDLAPPGADHDAALAQSLNPLCNWAWGAAMGPIIESYLPRLPKPPSGRDPRVVLVPMGDLARIPWQAARRKDGRYATELIAISQAASARMLCRSAALSVVPPSPAGLLVGDPDTGGRAEDLPAARLEAYAIRQAYYRGARYLGRLPHGPASPSGTGTRIEVRDWLAASNLASGGMLHLACHGDVRAGTDPTASLVLAGNDNLSAQELIACMAQQPNRAIGLVVLSACRSGLSLNGYDEAYSLGTAFLAGGARAVLSTQWSIDDSASAAMMFMFHHFLRTDGLPSWAALREAQLWMLNRGREIPDAMPVPLRKQIRPETLHHLVFWAAFVHWGQ